MSDSDYYSMRDNLDKRIRELEARLAELERKVLGKESPIKNQGWWDRVKP